MLEIGQYNRQFAYAYAARWAFDRNPLFYNFTGIGGDCTNFVSQCIFAGCCEMNYTPNTGWYYRGLNDRSPSWSGVSFFYDFITTNQGVGTYLVSAHSDDAFDRRLDSYTYEGERFIHIEGFRRYVKNEVQCFENLYQGISLP